jgi:hypothetical protein
MWINSHKNLAIAIGAGLSAVLLLFSAVLPIYRNASTILGKIEKKSVELESLNNKVTILTQLDPSVLQERVSTLDKALPPKKDVLLYLTSVDGLSRELGLTFGGLSLNPGEISEASSSAKKVTKSTKITGGLQGLETEIKINGGKESIYTFFRTIEEVLTLMQIIDIKVTVLSGEQYSLALTLSMLWAEPATLDVKSKITLFGETEDKYFQQLAQYRQFESAINVGANPEPKLDLFAPFSVQTEPVTPQQ